MLKRWKGHGFHMVLAGIENQTRPDKDMPFRVIGYDGAAYRSQLLGTERKRKDKRQKRKRNRRYPVVTIVLYFGEELWSYPKNLKECFYPPLPKGEAGVILDEYIQDYKVHIFDIPRLSKETVAKFQSDFKVVADYFVQMRENNDYIPSRETIEHVREVFDLMSAVSGDARFEEAYSEERSDTNMCEFLDRVEARGKTLGEACGIIKGTVATCREFHMTDEQILSKICVQFKLDEKEASGYL